MFRGAWSSLGKTRHEIPEAAREAVWRFLNGRITAIVHEVCDPLPMPRKDGLKLFREAAWAVAQHYELWPTPLIDVSPNLRIAASFALLRDGREGRNGHVYVAALPASIHSVTVDADQHVLLARLQAVCPPVAKRPHYQDGYLVGRFPFDGPGADGKVRDPAEVSDLGRRLVARIRLENAGNFWNGDFPQMSLAALMPSETDDQLLRGFLRYAPEIDAAMAEICRG